MNKGKPRPVKISVPQILTSLPFSCSIFLPAPVLFWQALTMTHMFLGTSNLFSPVSGTVHCGGVPTVLSSPWWAELAVGSPHSSLSHLLASPYFVSHLHVTPVILLSSYCFLFLLLFGGYQKKVSDTAPSTIRLYDLDLYFCIFTANSFLPYILLNSSPGSSQKNELMRVIKQILSVSWHLGII